MNRNDPKTYLWANVVSLMRGGAARADVVRKTKLTPGTVQRIQEGKTSIGVDVLADLAKSFNLEPWQVLVPDIDPDQIPELAYRNSGNERSEVQHQEPENTLNRSEVTGAIATLSQIIAGLTPVGRRTVARLLFELATNPGDAKEVGETIEALVARGSHSKHPAASAQVQHGETWEGPKASLKKVHTIEGAISPVKNITGETSTKQQKKDDTPG